MATKLSDILKQESSGIMFPFKNNVKPVTTTQNVYKAGMDGISSVKGTTYEGPTGIISYGSEEAGYPRQIKEIEKGMLPQFDQSQFPNIGEGKIETPVSTTPPITRPVEPDKPIMDPCPAGYRFDKKLQRCVLIEQPIDDKSDTQVGPVNPPRNIGSTAKALDNIAQAAIKEGLHTKYGEDITINIDNSSVLSKLGFVGKLVDGIFVKGPADNRLKEFGTYTDLSTDGIDITANKDGTFDVKMNQQGKYNFGQIQTDQSLRGNLASTQKTKNGNIIMGPNNTPMIVGPISVNTFGASSPTIISDTQRQANKKAADKRKAESDKAKKSIPSSAPKSKGGQGMLGFERGVKGTFAQAPSEVREVKKSKKQIENELDDLLKSNITESDRQAAKGTTGSSANKGKQGKIVCTMMNDSYGFGSFRNKIWLAQSRNLPREYEVGYHTLFLPLVKYAKQKGFTNNIVKKVLEHIAIHRTIDIRKQKYNRIDILGRMYRIILEPLCYITGGIKTWKKK